ncbi:MAG: VWA domain-containing protein [Clostridia bacterium]|nr:VWA domain-containing protein [Clostridia bacterium]
MHNFRIEFSHPWLLLLLIPALALTLWPYFRLAKRYRRTRNRITSIVLHLIVMVLAITTLAGITFNYQLNNLENEILLLVDVSQSEDDEDVAQTRDEFIELVLQDSQYDGFKVGVVTFGYNQVYAVPLTHEVTGIYDTYLAAEKPDVTATNLADALIYAKDLFTNPQTSKIVLITDGKETDKRAESVIRSIAAAGIKLDTAYIPSDIEDHDSQIIGVEFPEYHMSVDEEYNVEVKVQSKKEATALIQMMDNGSQIAVETVELIEGSQSITLPFTFTDDGLHEVIFTISTSKTEAIDVNNEYCTYHYLEIFDKLLVIESTDGESTAFVNMINAENDYEVIVKNITADDLPKTVEQLRGYDQVVLNNISNKNLTKDCKVANFDVMLNEYVQQYGGGLFTIGGSRDKLDENGNVVMEDGEVVKEANAYNRTDMANSLYQQMLPVQAINYTPPAGVVFCLDTSGSMASADNKGVKKLDSAKKALTNCLPALNDRDYMGIITFDDFQDTVLEMTPCIQQDKIRAAISSISKASASTELEDSVDRAGQMLRALKNVDKRHIIVISDGLAGDADAVAARVTELYENSNITLSVVGIAMGEGNAMDGYKLAEKMATAGHGRVITATGDALTTEMIKELNSNEVKELELTTFNPTINNMFSPLVNGLARFEDEEGGQDIDKLAVSLDGFYGVKARANADLVLTGDYNVPLYAQWKYGEGMVGSFMCDLSGVWSKEFMSNVNGQEFIKNVLNNLMPVSSIRYNEISAELNEDNYTNELNITYETEYKEGDRVVGKIYSSEGAEIADLNTLSSEGPCYVTLAMTEENKFSRCGFVLKESGVYKIVLIKYDASGAEMGRLELYKSFAYSKEYDSFLMAEEEITPQEKLTAFAEKSGGKNIQSLDDPFEIFEGFITDIDLVFDPRMLFMILAIVLFLLDIAVRKFKFKWPHELIRQYREKKKAEQENNVQK